MNKMNQSNSIVADKDNTFFGDRHFTSKDNSQSHSSFTKNSSNPERIYGELNNEITKAREGKNIDINLSNSKNNEQHVIDQLLDDKFWNQNNNDTQDSNHYYKKYDELVHKKRKTPRNKVNIMKNAKTQFIQNNNYDYSADTEEFSAPDRLSEENVDENNDNALNMNTNMINKITSIKPKTNDINNIDKQSIKNATHRLNTMNFEGGVDYHNKYGTHRIESEDGFIYPGSFTGSTYMNQYSINPLGMFGPPTPQKQNVNTLNCMQNKQGYELYNNSRNNNISNMIPNVNSYSNFPVVNRGSFISKSTHYSSNNKNKLANCVDNDTSVELVDSSINEEFISNDGKQLFGSNTFNTVYHSLSDRKVRLPTNESVDSNHSSQYNHLPQNSYKNLIGVNLNQQFSSNSNNMQFLSEDQLRKKFSASFNDNNYYMQAGNYDNPFSLNFNNCNTYNTNGNQTITKNSGFLTNEKRQIHKQSSNDNLQSIKVVGEKNILNLEEILVGRDNRTTIMIRNIPIKYTDEMLLKEVEEFKGKFDCLYLPFDYEKYGNKGYAFINFVHPLHIILFYEKFESKTWNYFESKKICELNAAKFQGITEIKRHARNYKGQKKPLFFFMLNNNLNLEISMKYISQFRFYYPNSLLEEKNGVFKILSFGS